jgi:hypothetical protein
LGVAKLVVTGCPLKETPLPETVIWTDSLQVSNTVRYPWQVSSSSTAADPLVLRHGAKEDVTVTVNVVRGNGLRAVVLEGYVQVSGQGTQNVSVSSVQVGYCQGRGGIALPGQCQWQLSFLHQMQGMLYTLLITPTFILAPINDMPCVAACLFIPLQQAAVLKRLGELQVVDAACPSAAMTSDGLITVPARPNKIMCSFRVDDLAPMDGAITPLVYVTPESQDPLPTMPTVYRVAGAPRVPLGDCATLGASRSLRKDGSDALVEGQPTSKSALPSTPVCSDFETSFEMTFGPFSNRQCGKYVFTGDFSARPVTKSVNGSTPVPDTARAARGNVTFAVQVNGCQRSAPASAGTGQWSRVPSSKGMLEN